MTGITAYGGYVPRLRLARQCIVEANAWAQPGLGRLGKGERSMCNWDEDPLTMAVEAARDCLVERDREGLAAVYLASTTLPFADRQNAGVVAGGLNLKDEIQTVDIASSQKAGTTALLAAMNAAGSVEGEILVIAADSRRTRAGAQQELLFGDGAAAFIVCGDPDRQIARLLGKHSMAVDFVDHYRAQDRRFDYYWEERWIRDEGVTKLVPAAISKALADAGIEAGEVDHLVMPSTLPKVPQKVASLVGIGEDKLADNLHGGLGEAGAAHPLIVLAHVLETARPGEKIVVASFGQGCDALVFEATERLHDLPPRLGISGHLARRRPVTNYNKFLAFNELVEREKGMRAELDNQTPLTQLYRRRDMLTGLVGGECKVCGTRQFPKSRICVNPNCNAVDSQQDFGFAEVPARIVTWSADHLTYCPDPPLHYGMIQFEGGGRFLANFADVEVGEVEVGQDMRMMFRVKDFDSQRGFRRYFWKAVPNERRKDETDGKRHQG